MYPVFRCIVSGMCFILLSGSSHVFSGLTDFYHMSVLDVYGNPFDAALAAIGALTWEDHHG